MAREVDNYVTLYGTEEETYQAERAIVLEYEKLNSEDGPEMLDRWKIENDFVIYRLDPFRSTFEDWSSGYLSELSEKYPNVAIEWAWSGSDHDRGCCIYKGGHSIAEYETLGHPGDQKANKFYYLEAIKLLELADAS